MCLVRRQYRCCWAQAQCYISMFGMSSSQSLTTIELFGVPVPSAVLVAVLTAVRWLGCALRTLTCGDRQQSVESAVDAWRWLPLRSGYGPLAGLAPVSWFDRRGRHDRPAAWAAWPSPSNAPSFSRHCATGPLAEQAAKTTNDWRTPWT